MNYIFRLQSIPAFWLFALLFFSLSSSSFAQTITGTVFRDFNADGAYTALPASGTYSYGEPGLGGVEIRAFNAAGTNVTNGSVQLSSSTGSYTITPSGAGPYRLEFTMPASLNSFVSGAAGSSSKTSVQFVATAPATANFGVNYPRDYCQSSPPLLVPCFVSGDPLLAGSNVADDKAIISVPYTAINSSPAPTSLASAGQVGSVWGSVYQRSSKKLFSAAFLKRHSGLGSLGLGGIYVTTVTSSPSSSTYVDLETLGINLGATALGSRNLPANGLTTSTDPTAFSLVGKAGLGDVALSDDESKLFVVDLFNKQLIILNIGNPAKATLTLADVQTVPIPTTSCTDGVARPFGISIYKGKAYVGVVCTGENNFNTAKTNLNAFVYEMNVATQTFTATPIFTIPLNYTKGDIHSTYPALGNVWSAWSDDFTKFNTNSTSAPATRTALPQALLSDISFTDNGDMVLGFMDRGGHQLGYRQRAPGDNSASPTLYSGYIGGDLLRARFDGTQWNLESNGRVSSPTSATLSGSGVGNGQGPGGGEFYGEDDYPDNNATAIHEETFQGGMSIVPGTNQVVATVMDPINVFSGGFSWFNNTDGNSDKRYQIYASASAGDVTLGKANGLGIISIACDPAPIQIGNRVWRDTDNDGVQDAGEPALAGVPVILKGPGLPPAGTTVTTGTNGEYYFSNATGTNATGFVYSLTGLSSGSSYSLCFPVSASAGALSLSTKPNTATGTNADAIDADPNSAGIISFTLGQAGENNFSYDAAYAPAVVCPTITVTPTNLPNAQANAPYSQTLTASGGQAPYSFSTIGSGFPANLSLSAGGVVSGVPLTSGIVSVTVRVTDAQNCMAVIPITITIGTGPVCSLAATATPGACQGPANTYSLTGTISANDGPGTQSLTVSVGNAYTLVTLTGNGPASYTMAGLPAIGGTQTVSIVSSVGACGSASQVFTAPAPCAPMLDLDKQVSLSKAQIGDVLVYTIRLGNSSSVAASNTVVDDVLGAGAKYIPNSATVSAGSFSPGLQGGTWAVASVPGNTTLTLTFSASITSDGVIYNTATIPGKEAKVCTSVPILVCKGAPIAMQIDAPTGYTRYQWYLTTVDGTTLVSDVVATSANVATANSYTATRPGEYQVVVDDGVPNSCPDLSCCPVIIEETQVPLFTAITRTPTCVSNVSQATGQITLTGLGANPTTYSFQISTGSTFNANTATAAQSVSASGPIATSLTAGTYTVRVIDSIGCSRDVIVPLTANCGCKPDICMPVMITKTKSIAKRR